MLSTAERNKARAKTERNTRIRRLVLQLGCSYSQAADKFDPPLNRNIVAGIIHRTTDEERVLFEGLRRVAG